MILANWLVGLIALIIGCQYVLENFIDDLLAYVIFLFGVVALTIMAIIIKNYTPSKKRPAHLKILLTYLTLSASLGILFHLLNRSLTGWTFLMVAGLIGFYLTFPRLDRIKSCS